VSFPCHSFPILRSHQLADSDAYAAYTTFVSHFQAAFLTLKLSLACPSRHALFGVSLNSENPLHLKFILILTFKVSLISSNGFLLDSSIIWRQDLAEATKLAVALETTFFASTNAFLFALSLLAFTLK
jgi:hypothetical protein